MQAFFGFRLCSSARRLVPLFAHIPYWGFSRKAKRSHPNPPICSICRKQFTVLSSVMTYHWVYNNINSIGATTGVGSSYLSGLPAFTLGFYWGSRYSIFSYMCLLCRSLFVLLSFFAWPLCCLFFDLVILITPLISSNSSNID